MATNIEIKRYSSGVWGTVYPKANWNNMDNKPSTFTPSSHTHSQYLEKTGANGLSEGTSDITDNTEILTSYASNNGFADTNAAGVIYRRDAVKMYNYIKGKLDSVYQPKGTYLTSHQDISGKADKASITAGWYRRVQVNAQGIVIGGDQTDANDDTNTWRKVQLNGVDKLGNGISTNPLNIKAGSNMTITESSGTFTFAATDTTYESKAAASGGTAVSLVTTGEKYTWNNKANSSHTHSSITTVGDNRSVATKPNDYNNKFIFQGLKSNSTIGSPTSDYYSYVIGLRGWSDSSGGNAHELAFNDTGIYIRNGATTSWGSWKKLATISDITSAIGDAIAASY